MKEIKTIEDMCEVSPVCFKLHYEYMLNVHDTYSDVCKTMESIMEVMEVIIVERNILLSVLNVYRCDFEKIDQSTHKKLHGEICSLAKKLMHDWFNEWCAQRFGI